MEIPSWIVDPLGECRYRMVYFLILFSCNKSDKDLLILNDDFLLRVHEQQYLYRIFVAIEYLVFLLWNVQDSVLWASYQCNLQGSSEGDLGSKWQVTCWGRVCVRKLFLGVSSTPVHDLCYIMTFRMPLKAPFLCQGISLDESAVELWHKSHHLDLWVVARASKVGFSCWRDAETQSSLLRGVGQRLGGSRELRVKLGLVGHGCACLIW